VKAVLRAYDKGVADARDARGQFIGQSVGEVILRRITGEIALAADQPQARHPDKFGVEFHGQPDPHRGTSSALEQARSETELIAPA
jgi:hypothetical protein